MISTCYIIDSNKYKYSQYNYFFNYNHIFCKVHDIIHKVTSSFASQFNCISKRKKKSYLIR